MKEFPQPLARALLAQKEVTMAQSHESHYPPHEELVEIKKRLREGKLEQADVRTLEKLVVSVEQAAHALRAAMVE